MFSSLTKYVADVGAKAAAVSTIQKAILSALTVFLPIKSILTTVFVLIIADMILGIAAAVKRKEKISSSGLKRTIVKLFMYELSIILGYLAEQNLLSDFLPVTKIVSAFIGLTEIASLMENMAALAPELLPLATKIKAVETQPLDSLSNMASTVETAVSSATSDAISSAKADVKQAASDIVADAEADIKKDL